MKAKFVMLGLLVLGTSLPSAANPYAMSNAMVMGASQLMSLSQQESAEDIAQVTSSNQKQSLSLKSSIFEMLTPKSTSTGYDLCAGAPQSTFPFEPLARPNCSRLVSETNPGSFCQCISASIVNMAPSHKREIEAQSAASKREIQKQATRLLAESWFKSYLSVINASTDMSQLLSKPPQGLGFSCSPQVIQDDMTKFISGNQRNCDPEQGEIMRELIAEHPQGLEKIVVNANKIKAEKANGVYQCLSESDLNLLSLNLGEPGEARFVTVAGTVQAANRGRVIARKNAIEEQLKELDAKKDAFLKDPRSFDLVRTSLNNTHLIRAIESLPIAQNLIKMYTRSHTIDTARNVRRELSRDERLENYKKLQELLGKMRSFYLRIGRVTKDELNARADEKLLDQLAMKKVFDGYAEFNDSLASDLKELTRERNGGSSAFKDFSTSSCMGLMRDLRLISCKAPPMDKVGFSTKFFAQSREPIYSADMCAEAAANPATSGDVMAKCLANDVAACQMVKNPGFFAGLRSLPNYDDFSADGLEVDDVKRDEKESLEQTYCSDYTKWVDTKACPGLAAGSPALAECLAGVGSVEKFAAANSGNALANLVMAKEDASIIHGGAFAAGTSRPQDVQAVIETTNVQNQGLLSRLLPEDMFQGAFGQSESSSSTLVTSTFMSDLGMAARDLAPMVGAQAQVAAVAPQVTLPYAATAQSLKRAVAQKDEEIQMKEEEIVQRQTQFQAPSTPPAEKSALAAQIAALEADLKRLREDREDLEKQQRIAATEAEVQNSGNASRAPASTRTARAASTKADAPEVQSSGFSIGGGSSGGSGGGTGGAQASQAAASANFGTGASFGGKLGAASGASIGNLSSAVRENLTLTVGGQAVSSANVVSLEVPSTQDPAVVEQAISAQKDKLKFNADGWATVEIYDQATKTAIYYQVRLNDSKLVLQQIPGNEQQGIQKQVREWTASYQNLLKRLQRAPAQVSN